MTARIWRTGPGYRLLISVLRGRRRALAWILLWSVLESLPPLLSGLLVSFAIDGFLNGDVGGALGSLGLFLAAALVGALATRQMFPWLADVVESVRDSFVVATVEGVLAEAVRSTGPPDAAGVARLTEHVQSVREVLFALLRIVRQIAFAVVAALIGLCLLAPIVALVTMMAVGLAIAVFVTRMARLAATQKAVLLAEEAVAQRAGAVFGGIRDVVACAGERQAMADVGRAVDDHVQLTRTLARTTAFRMVLIFVGCGLPLVALLAAAPWLLRNGHLSVGELVGAVTYLTTGLEPALRRMLEVLATWGLEMAVSVVRLGEGFAAGGSARTGRPVPAQGTLTAQGLTFGYGPHAAPVFRDLGLRLAEGEHLAVVGPSGTGKSTLVNLLAGLLPPGRGEITLGGTPLGDITDADLRRTIVLIPQEAYVFAGTLRENICYLAPDARECEISAAVAAVGLGAVVARLGGLDAAIGAGGAELSHGEAQLVALARVYLSQARIVILDEATSGLDPDAEATADAAFAGSGVTLIVVAHRISSARRAGRVLLLDGDTAVTGTHDELLQRSTTYADLAGHWRLPVRPG
ncbi:ATP-binding cassette subfamily C protein [Kibdelosporangium banguiense]|uniref:ATP-binding cassette subfamily C protein n=1 Tax=Kibdelosporangium banguiense TaxID=1365924 RepID=A0ABS4TWQ6_9PSEU|nr:ABC transporter ATP-binding protein [Kibdelosporangium banguiense]MBP2328419.1 ATP-binding cassette subfamily C protein [Kibdelosporangium banguiense]